MIPVSLTLIVAYLLYRCQQSIRKSVCCDTKRYGRNCLQVVVIIAMVGPIVTLLVLYELVLQVQVQIEGNSALAASIISTVCTQMVL